MCECAKQVVFTGSRLVLGSGQQREPCSSLAASYTACSQGRLCGSTSGLYGTKDLDGTETRSERFDSGAAGFPSFCGTITERLTDLSQHLEEVGQSSLLLLQDVLHLRLLLLFLRRRVHVEALQVPQATDDLT